MSSIFVNGDKEAVAPVSALKMLRAGTKRRRGEGASLGNENAHKEAHESISICLANNPDFSLPLGITELSGPAGVGKTQLALSLCADCVQSGNQQAVFIQLGGSSSHVRIASRRIEQMLRSRMHAKKRHDNPTVRDTVHECLNRVLVHWICNSEELMELLQSSLPRLLQGNPTVSVVILDGIANLFRLVEPHGATRGNPWHDRAVTFFQISNLCKQVSSQFQIPFLVLNECTSKLHHHPGQDTVLEPALGLAWAQCVNASFFAKRESRLTNATKDSNKSGDERKKPFEVCHRTLRCLRAPHISSEHAFARFWIDRSGVVLA